MRVCAMLIRHPARACPEHPCRGSPPHGYHPAVNSDLDILQEAADLARAGTPFVLITVTSAKGSTPRNAGAKMIWKGSKDDGVLVGTVGGGQFELLVLDAARTHLRNRSCGSEHYVLGADADQCCGGALDVFFEYHGRTHRVVVFGAGHVASELAMLLSSAPLDLVIADDRPEWNSAERFPRCTRIHTWDDGVRLAQENTASTLACVMTCSHDTDFELLRRLLEKPPAFTGLIGSRSKRVCLFGRLVASGVPESQVSRVHCPIGVGDLGKEPRMVAISMAAQIVLEAKKLPAW